MEFYAHKMDDSNAQTVKQHLEGTAEKAKSFSIPEISDIVYEIAMLHDIFPMFLSVMMWL